MAPNSPPPSISHLISSYPILSILAEYVSALDLFHLAQTNRNHHAHILGSRTIFEKLRSLCLCDGRGLVQRQNFSGRYCPNYWTLLCGLPPMVVGDEEIEVKLYNVKCDEAGALPCRRCGINVCEECRYYDRLLSVEESYVEPRYNWRPLNIMCLCRDCDFQLESDNRKLQLSDTCDCNLCLRWLCIKCEDAQRKETTAYYDTRTKEASGQNNVLNQPEEWGPDEAAETKQLEIYGKWRNFYCPCGAAVAQETVPRCTWCRRRVKSQDEWLDERNQLARLDKPGGSFYVCSSPRWRGWK
ncbi:uncharacterized protein BDZ83DRAFT_586224 [Colletotrichum acutatum]|uniref:Uncharacterized protein n=1 Tax=Glomerella acutata TaxID=27357 RepID=A0AAD8UBG6_GLOAC|nr:uncharacterized protein BDZ83DRAFT_586224 [Colletotrichum acutatum]KAK1718077.1 hypothetical protein BDZ83DRAFT_586224 [Colletotrichum acutatum]